MRIITRNEWGFDGWAGGVPSSVDEKAQRTEFFTHYEGAAAVLNQTGNSVPRAIHRMHKANGWKGIGYGHVVTADGTIYEGRGFNLRGSHCPDHNTQGYSAQIHLGGNEHPTPAQLTAQRWLYDEACRRSGRKLAMKGHRDGVATACPGNVLYAWVKAGMPATAAPAGSGGATPKPPTLPTPKPTTALVVDGKLGPATIKRWQKVMGTEVDGVISRPSELIRAVQRRLNPSARLVVDGKFGPATIRALQRHLGTEPDGVISHPSEAVRALQRRLNLNRF